MTVYQLITGFNGVLPVKDWTWELYASHGQSSTNTQINGVVSLDCYRTIVTSPNYGRGFVGTQNAFNGEIINGTVQGADSAARASPAPPACRSSRTSRSRRTASMR